MEIRNSSPTQNFGAKYISTTKIKEKLPFIPFYKKIDVDFVELEQKYDIPSIKTYVAQDPYSALGAEILTNLRCLTDGSCRAFALTRQRTGHQDLNPDQIIGLCDGTYTCDWRDGNIFFINHLETKSENNKICIPDKKLISFLGFQFKVSDKIKGAGKAILRNIIKIHDESLDSIQLEALQSGRSFYRHLGFKNDCIDPDLFRLPSDKFHLLTES